MCTLVLSFTLILALVFPLFFILIVVLVFVIILILTPIFTLFPILFTQSHQCFKVACLEHVQLVKLISQLRKSFMCVLAVRSLYLPKGCDVSLFSHKSPDLGVCPIVHGADDENCVLDNVVRRESLIPFSTVSSFLLSS
jgi:hypothetical protein